MKRSGWSILGVVALVGCGGYDAAYDCEQTAACEERITGQPTSEAAIEGCEAASDSIYDDMSDSRQDYIDEVFEACENETSCAYIVCACDYSGSTDSHCERARAAL